MPCTNLVQSPKRALLFTHAMEVFGDCKVLTQPARARGIRISRHVGGTSHYWGKSATKHFKQQHHKAKLKQCNFQLNHTATPLTELWGGLDCVVQIVHFQYHTRTLSAKPLQHNTNSCLHLGGAQYGLLNAFQIPKDIHSVSDGAGSQELLGCQGIGCQKLMYQRCVGARRVILRKG